MNIIVAGGSGFIGNYLIRRLIEMNENIVVLGRDKSVRSIKIYGNDIKYIPTDYSIEELERIFNGCDCIINLVSQRYTNLEKDDLSLYKENIKIANSIFTAAYRCGIKNVINISSISVYSLEQKIPWKEDDYTVPGNWYGVSKLMIDNIADYFNHHFSMCIKSLRLAQVIGYGERKGYMLDTFMRRAFNKQPIIIYGKGEGRRQYIYVEDVINCICNIMNREDIKGIYNIGMGFDVSHFELASLINKNFDNEKEIVFDFSKEEDKSINLMDISKAKEQINWKPKWTLDEAFMDIMKKIKEK